MTKRLREGLITEAAIEKFFGISVSKLRTAQRLGYISSDAARNEEKRFVRVWSMEQLGRAYLASSESYYFAIPFQVAVELIQHYESVKSEDLGDAMVARDWLTEHPKPVVYLTDRRYISWTAEGYPEELLGTIQTGHDGRQMFMPAEPDALVPDLNRVSARCAFFPERVREEFLDIWSRVEVTA